MLSTNLIEVSVSFVVVFMLINSIIEKEKAATCPSMLINKGDYDEASQ